MCCGWQHHIVRLDACQLFENGAWRVAETSALLPHLQAFPQNEGEKANQNMGLNAVLELMPYRTDVQLILLDPERSFGLCELDVSLPKLLIAPVVEVVSRFVV
jgi:hypothetical protein